ncbi:hypothetical protein CO2235_90018 [Cupriavidus oxalaticus]|uniref:Uncharacterized protein n=1 Tax=Cupriavidus oxalaticus TaxID=96344 RepID=A0A375GEN1_9BURK|nr:hypothetical protein CO2235_90018 [Cupriavidus oxalaticus]
MGLQEVQPARPAQTFGIRDHCRDVEHHSGTTSRNRRDPVGPLGLLNADCRILENWTWGRVKPAHCTAGDTWQSSNRPPLRGVCQPRPTRTAKVFYTGQFR